MRMPASMIRLFFLISSAALFGTIFGVYISKPAGSYDTTNVTLLLWFLAIGSGGAAMAGARRIGAAIGVAMAGACLPILVLTPSITVAVRVHNMTATQCRLGVLYSATGAYQAVAVNPRDTGTARVWEGDSLDSFVPDEYVVFIVMCDANATLFRLPLNAADPQLDITITSRDNGQYVFSSSYDHADQKE